MTQQIHVIDSHTAGEPTRVAVRGGPPLGDGTLRERFARFQSAFDRFRTAVVTEPRGYDVLVGALLCESDDPACLAAVIFFNNVGYLGMCGHGMIGVVETLRYLGRITPGEYAIETPVGIVTTRLHDDGSVSIRNVPSYRLASDVHLDVAGIGSVVGDVAWGGNWFFLVDHPRMDLRLDRIDELKRTALAIRHAVNAAGYPEVDHVELFDAVGDRDSNSNSNENSDSDSDSDSKNFVLCPGSEYDRSPCGTGTSAKLACLAADGILSPGEPWLQEGILGTMFRGEFEWSDDSKQRIDPTIRGSAFVTSDSRLVLDQRDPFCWGIASPEE